MNSSGNGKAIKIRLSINQRIAKSKKIIKKLNGATNLIKELEFNTIYGGKVEINTKIGKEFNTSTSKQIEIAQRQLFFLGDDSIKKDPSLKNIPVIILTALIQDLTKVKSLMSGADDYLMKSEIMPGEVIEKVKIVLDKRKGGEEKEEQKPEQPTPSAQTPPPAQNQNQTQQ